MNSRKLNKFKLNEVIGIDEKRLKIYELIYITITLISICIGIYTADGSSEVIQVNKLPVYAIGVIFLNNAFIIFMWLLYSPIGLSIYSIIMFIKHMASAGMESGIKPIFYYGISLPHGIGEIFACFMVFVFTLEQFRIWIRFYRYRSYKELELFYKKSLKNITIIIIVTLLISAVFEVLFSNRIINIIVN